MKINGEVKIKDNITVFDLADVIDTVVSFIIRKDNNGIKYTPYYKEIGYAIGVVRYLIEGIEIEKDDDIYSESIRNKEISNVLDSFKLGYPSKYEFIMNNVTDIVEQKKQEYSAPDFTDIKEQLKKSIAQEQALNDLNIKLAKKQNTLLSQQIKTNEYQMKVMDNMTPEESAELNKKLLSGEYDINKVAEMAVRQYLESDIHKGKEKELIESQQATIHDLSKYKAMHDARNVLSNEEK